MAARCRVSMPTEPITSSINFTITGHDGRMGLALRCASCGVEMETERMPLPLAVGLSGMGIRVEGAAVICETCAADLIGAYRPAPERGGQVQRLTLAWGKGKGSR